jgi:hypothetical protein
MKRINITPIVEHFMFTIALNPKNWNGTLLTWELPTGEMRASLNAFDIIASIQNVDGLLWRIVPKKKTDRDGNRIYTLSGAEHIAEEQIAMALLLAKPLGKNPPFQHILEYDPAKLTRLYGPTR